MHGRSKIATYLSVLALATAIVWLATGLAFLAGGSVGAVLGVPEGGEAMALGASFFAIGVVAVGVAYGFWRTLPWARSAAQVVFGLSIVLSVFAVLIGAGLFSAVVPAALAAVVLWLLLQPRVRSELQPAT
jgi:hypothetical protein